MILCGFSSCSDEISVADFSGSYQATFDGMPGTIFIQQLTDSAQADVAFSDTTFKIRGFINENHFQSEITGSAAGALDLKLDLSQDGNSLSGTFAIGERVFQVHAVRLTDGTSFEVHSGEGDNHHH